MQQTSKDNRVIGYDVVEKGPAVRVNNKSDIFALEITRLSFDVCCMERPYVIPKDPNVARIGGKTGNLQYDDTFIPFHAADSPAVRVNNKSDIFALEITRLSFDVCCMERNEGIID
jgi:hypothetical protein